MNNIIYDINSGRPLILGHRMDHNAAMVTFTGYVPLDENHSMSLLYDGVGVFPLDDFSRIITQSMTKENGDFVGQLLELAENNEIVKRSDPFDMKVLWASMETEPVVEEDPNMDIWYSEMLSLKSEVERKLENGEFDGVGIESVKMNPDYTLTITLSNNEQITTESIRGAEGNGINRIEENEDHSLTISFTDGNSFTTGVIMGRPGEDGNGIESVKMNEDYSMTINFTKSEPFTTPSLRGDDGDPGVQIVENLDEIDPEKEVVIVDNEDDADAIELAEYDDLLAEARERITGDENIQRDLNSEVEARTLADNILKGLIDAIDNIIPNQASAENQLADKEFVNSSLSSNTAYFRGTFDSVDELNQYSGEITNNDYAFVKITDENGGSIYKRYKYNSDSLEWIYEYDLNAVPFTASDWAAIRSGITAELVSKLSALYSKSEIDTIVNNLMTEIGKKIATDNVPGVVKDVLIGAKGSALTKEEKASALEKLGAASEESVTNLSEDLDKKSGYMEYDTATGKLMVYADNTKAVLLAEVPIPTADLKDYVKNTDYATESKGGVFKPSSNYAMLMNDGKPYAQNRTLEQYNAMGNGMFIGKGTFENIIPQKVKDNLDGVEANLIDLDKPWMLKGKITMDNINDGVEVDLTGCTELIVKGDTTATGSCNMFVNETTNFLSGIAINQRRIFYSEWVDNGIIFDCKSYWYNSSTTLISRGTPYVYSLGNVRLESIKKFILSAPSLFTLCNIEIYAR